MQTDWTTQTEFSQEQEISYANEKIRMLFIRIQRGDDMIKLQRLNEKSKTKNISIRTYPHKSALCQGCLIPTILECSRKRHKHRNGQTKDIS